MGSLEHIDIYSLHFPILIYLAKVESGRLDYLALRAVRQSWLLSQFVELATTANSRSIILFTIPLSFIEYKLSIVCSTNARIIHGTRW